ncbi:MAG TPA: DsbC family protein [Sedimenticola sp.]|nr:DsbC family protein [Sedimenticola sp.]
MIETIRAARVLLFTLLLLSMVSSALAGEQPDGNLDGVLKTLQERLPEISEVTATPVPGVYEALMGGQIIYITGDGRYVFQGDLLDLQEEKNLTKPRLNAINAKQIAAVGEENMVIFGPKDAKHTITVFTDIDCGYCRKLHKQMKQYNDEGIRIRYLFFPRAGIGSSAYDKAVSVWCSDDRQQAMTDAKKGIALPRKQCDNPVSDEYRLGRKMGVTGTPTLVLENGEMIPGYLPPKRLIRLLDQKKEAAE